MTTVTAAWIVLIASLVGCHQDVELESDLAVSVATTSTIAASPIDYELHVTNNGPTRAGMLTVIHTLPMDTTFSSAQGEGWTCTESLGKVTCDRAELEVGAAPVIEIDAVAPIEGGVAVARTTVSPFSDPDISNNEVTTSTIVVASAELSIAATGSPDPAYTSGMLTYTIDVANQGPSTATEVSVDLDTASGLTFVSGTGQGWTCYDTSTPNCSRDTLHVGAAPPITVTAHAPPAAGMIVLHGSVSGSSTDPLLSNNEVTVATTIVSVADLSVTITDRPDPVALGDYMMYPLTVVNAGPTTANAVTVTVALPTGTTFVSAGGNGWSCGMAAQVVTCTQTTLAVGTSYLNVNVTAPSSPGTLTATASVTATSDDPVASNNTASTSTTAAPSADLSIALVDSPDPVLTNATLAYAVSVENLGPGTATSIVVTDTLPAGTTLSSATGTGWSCGSSGQIVTCSCATLPVGSAPSISIAVTTPPTMAILQNNVSVSGATADQFSTNNSASTYTMVQTP